MDPSMIPNIEGESISIPSLSKPFHIEKSVEKKEATSKCQDAVLEIPKRIPRKFKWELPSKEELATVKYGDDDLQDNRPLLTTRCTSKYYETLCESFLSFENGSVFVEEYPVYPPHSAAVGELVDQILGNARQIIKYMVDTTYHIPGVGQRQPDACFCPRHLPNPGIGGVGAANPQGSAWPTLLVEVSYQRSLQSGLSKVPQWLAPGTNVQVVLIFKLYPRHNGLASMVALRFERGVVGPSYAVSFGTRPMAIPAVNFINALGGAQLVGVGTAGAVACAGVGIPAYQLRLPVGMMVVGVPAMMVPAGLPANYQIELFDLQQSVLTVLP